MNAKKILHVSKVTGVAGSENHLLYLLRGLRAEGLDAEFLILTEPGNPAQGFFDRAAARGIPAHRLPIHADLDPTLFGRLTRFIRRGGYDLVHTHLIHADLHGILAARCAGVPRVVTSRHNDDRFRRMWVLRLLNRWLWRRVDHGIAISDWIRRFCIEVEGAPPEKITTVHYGLDPDSVRTGSGARAVLAAELGLDPAAPLVGSVCRLTRQKGIDIALRTFWQIAEAVPDAHYIIAGDGPLRGQLEEMAGGFGLGDRVHFLGWRDDPHAVIAALDVLLVPSLWEGFGLVLLEAMAHSVPIIASRVSAIPEIVVHGDYSPATLRTGLLVAPGDFDALASSLSTLLQNPDLAHEMGARGRQRLETHFTVARMVEGTIGVYERLWMRSP
jgi:glycosyltransferase involved in cell wall biosynthesis